MGEARYGKSERYSYRPKTHLTEVGAYEARQASSPAERDRERRNAIDVLLGRFVGEQALDLETSRKILRPEEGMELFTEAVGTFQLKARDSGKLSKQQIAGMFADIRSDAIEVIMNTPIGGGQATDVA